MSEPTAMTPEILESFLRDIRLAVLDTGLIGSGLEGEVNDILWNALMRLQNLTETVR